MKLVIIYWNDGVQLASLANQIQILIGSANWKWYLYWKLQSIDARRIGLYTWYVYENHVLLDLQCTQSAHFNFAHVIILLLQRAGQMDVTFHPFRVLNTALFEPLSDYSGMSIDKVSQIISANVTPFNLTQIRYVILLFVSIFLGFFMKHVLHPSRVNNTMRHCYSFVVGLVFGLMCFGVLYVHVASLLNCVMCTWSLQWNAILVHSGRDLLRVLVNLTTACGANVSHSCMLN